MPNADAIYLPPHPIPCLCGTDMHRQITYTCPRCRHAFHLTPCDRSDCSRVLLPAFKALPKGFWPMAREVAWRMAVTHTFSDHRSTHEEV